MKTRRNLLVVRLVSWLTVVTFLSSSVSWAGVADVQKLASQSLVVTSVPLSNALAEGQMLFEQLQIHTTVDRGEFYRRLSEADVGDVECFDSIDPDNPNERAYYVINLEKRYFSRITTSVEVNDLFYQLVSGYWPSVSSEVRIFNVGSKIFYQWLFTISDDEVEFIRSCIDKTMSFSERLRRFLSAPVDEEKLNGFLRYAINNFPDLERLSSIKGGAAWKGMTMWEHTQNFLRVLGILKGTYRGEIDVSALKNFNESTEVLGARYLERMVEIYSGLDNDSELLLWFVALLHETGKIWKTRPGENYRLAAEYIRERMDSQLAYKLALGYGMIGDIFKYTEIAPGALRELGSNLSEGQRAVLYQMLSLFSAIDLICKGTEGGLDEVTADYALFQAQDFSLLDSMAEDWENIRIRNWANGDSQREEAIYNEIDSVIPAQEKGVLLSFLRMVQCHHSIYLLKNMSPSGIVKVMYLAWQLSQRTGLMWVIFTNDKVAKELEGHLAGVTVDNVRDLFSSAEMAAEIQHLISGAEISVYDIPVAIKDGEIVVDVKVLAEASSRPQAFAPIGTEEVDYSELTGSFKDDYEVSLDLLKGSGSRFKARDDSKSKAVELASLLNKAVDELETILAGTELAQYWQDLVRSEHKRAPPIRIRVNSNLPFNSVRYKNPDTGIVEIIFNEDFINTILSDCRDYPQISYLLAERIFHELGHSPVKSFYQELKQEYELLKRDVELHELLQNRGIQGYIDQYFMERNPAFPSGSYFRLIQALIDDPSIVENFDELIETVESLENDARNIYDRRDSNYINDATRNARDDRIDRAYKAADPDFYGVNPAKTLANKKSIRGTFLSRYLEILGHRAIAQGRESFLFLAKEKEPLTAVPFDQLKMPRVPPGRVDKNVPDYWQVTVVEPEKEKERWARQYFAIHKGRRFSDGIGVTEAENGRGMQQRWHVHETTQEFTISICDDTQLRYGHELAKGTVTEMRGNKEYVAEGPDQGREVVAEADLKIVVDGEENVPFGHIICMPKNTYHTLRNTSKTKPSIDFTVKDPVTQLIKTFSPPEEKLLERVEVREIDHKSVQGGEQYTLAYPANYCSKMLINPDTGEMFYRFDKGGNPVPVMYDPIGVTLQLFVVNNSEETEQLTFTPFYDDTQVIRIFPWPRVIPEDKEELQKDHEWVLDRDHTKIKAVVKIYNEQGDEVKKERRIVNGGDLVILDNSLKKKYGNFKFSIENVSGENFKLVFYTLEPKWDILATFKSILELTQEKKQDVKEAGRKLLKDFIGEQDDTTLAMLLQTVLDERFSADEMSEVIRAFIAQPEGWGLERFKKLQQKFMVYSAPPGGGKGEVMDATFEGGIGKYSDMIGKLILYHTRDPRDKKGICEKDGIKYHFRNEEQHEDLKAKGHIFLTKVNKQTQGLAPVDFDEDEVEINDVSGAGELKENDEIREYKAEDGKVKIKRGDQEIILEGVYIPKDKRGILLEGDVVAGISGSTLTVTRKIKGMSSIFNGKKPVILEGGYGWFRQLTDAKVMDYQRILSVFISPFTDKEIDVRTTNSAWIEKTFDRVEERVLAYKEMARIIRDVKKREIDLEDEPELKKMIIDFVKKPDQTAIDHIELANAELIESQDFIDDLNKLLTDFGKVPILPKEKSMIRAMSYEIHRRILSRPNEKLLPFSREKLEAIGENIKKYPERFSGEGVDTWNDRYNRILEGLMQIRHRNEYDHVVVNRWGFTQEEIESNITRLREQFSSLFFANLIKGMIGSLNSETGNRVDLKSIKGIQTAGVKEHDGDVDSKLEHLWILDANGRILGKKKRKEVHKDGDWHAGTWILAFDQGGNVLLQQRSPEKSAYPGCWEFSASGHIPYGNSYRETAVKEIKEELGLEIEPDRLVVFGEEGGFVQNREVSDEYMKPGAERYVERERLALYLLMLTDEELSQIKPNPEVQVVQSMNLEQLREEMEENPTDFTLTLQDVLMNKKHYNVLKEMVEERVPKIADAPDWQDVIGADWQEYLAGGFKRGRHKIAEENNPETADETANFNFRFNVGFTLRDIFIIRVPVVKEGVVTFDIAVRDDWLTGVEEQGVKFSERQKERYRKRVGRLFEDLKLTEEELYSGVLALRRHFFGDRAGVLASGKIYSFKELDKVVLEDNEQSIDNLFQQIKNEQLWTNRIRMACLADLTHDPARMDKNMKRAPAVDDSVSFAGEVIDTSGPVHYIHFVGSASSLAVDLRVFADLLIKEWKNRKNCKLDGLEDFKISFVVKKERMVSNYNHHNIASTIEATEADILVLLERPEFGELKEAYEKGLFEIVVSGSEMMGTDLRKASPELIALLLKIKEYQRDPESNIRGVVGVKGEENNVTINLMDLEHYRLFLSRQPKTQFATDCMLEGAPGQFILRVPAGIEVFKETCPKRVRRLTVKQYIEAREMLMREGIGEDEFRERLLKRREEAKKYLTVVEALAPEVLLDEILRNEITRDELKTLIDQTPDAYLAIIEKNRELRRKFAEKVADSIGGKYSSSVAYLYTADGIKVTEEDEGNSIGKVITHVFSLPNDEIMRRSGGLIPVFAPEFGDIQLISPKVAADRRGYRNRFIINGLYFWTKPLNDPYNACRKFRPWEMIEDYGYYVGGKIEYGRVTSLPCFNKGFVAKKKDGSLVFGAWKLGAGKLKITERKQIEWEEANVNPTTAISSPIEVYTPLHYENLLQGKGRGKCVVIGENGEEELQNPEEIKKNSPPVGTRYSDDKFEIKVGEGRYNLIVIGNEIRRIIYGDVFIPSTGVVISLDKETFRKVLGRYVRRDKKKIAEYKDSLEDRIIYKWRKKPDISFDLSLPEELEGAEWCLGGGVLIVNNGRVPQSYDELAEGLSIQGWFNPLSMKTQETSVEKIWIQPRMAMGLTEDGRFFAIAYDGRQVDSLGANFGEMYKIAEQKLGRIRYLLNLDSGASVSMNFIDTEGNLVTVNTTTEVPNQTVTDQLRAVNSMFVIDGSEYQRIGEGIDITRYALSKDKLKEGNNLVKAQRIFGKSFIKMEKIARRLMAEGRKLKVSVLFAYYDDPRIFPRDVTQLGEDSLRKKVEQLQELFGSYTDVLDWETVIIDNTTDKPGGRTLPDPNEGLIGEVTREKGLREGQIRVIPVPAGYRHPEYGHYVTKGGSVYLGMQKLLEGKDRPDVLLYTDADMTTDLRQTGLLLGPIVLENRKVAVGTRASKDAVALPGPSIEDQLIGKASSILKKNYLLKPLVMDRKVSDTQCGFKAFTGDFMEQVLPLTRDGGWAFDTELLMLALKEDEEIISSPILWCDSPEASSTSIRVRWQMLRDWVVQYKRRMKDGGFVTEDLSTLEDRQIKELNAYIEECLLRIKEDTEAQQAGRWIGLLNMVEKWRIEKVGELLKSGKTEAAQELRREILSDYEIIDRAKNELRQKKSEEEDSGKKEKIERLLAEIEEYEKGVGKNIEMLEGMMSPIVPSGKAKASQYPREVEETKKEEVLYQAILDVNGNIVGEEFKERSEKNEKFSGFFSREKLTAVLNQVKAIYGVGIFGAAKKIVIVDNLGGLDSSVRDEKGAVAVFQDGNILIDIDAFRNDRVLRDVVEHELWESILELVESNLGVSEATAIYQNLKAFIDMPEEEQRALVEFLSQPGNGLESQGYAELLQYIVDNKIREDGLISLAISYVLQEPRYSHLRESLGAILDADIKKAEKKLNLAVEIYEDLIKVTTEWKSVIDKVKLAESKSKVIMKIRMVVNSRIRWELDFVDVLVENNKYIMLDRNELAKPENAYIKDWVERITEGRGKSPFIYSDEGMPEGVSPEDVIDLMEPDRVNDRLPQDRLYLPLPYSISSIYLAGQVVLAGGKVEQIKDKLALNTIKALYEALFGRDVTDVELERLFRTPWMVLPEIARITGTLNVLRKAIAEIEVAA